MSSSVGSSLAGRAVVLGGSLAGLLAARVLADTYDVVVLERDAAQDAPGARRGVPQGRHVHALLARGGGAFEELLPGISNELLEAGAVGGDVLADTTWCPHGYRLRNVPCGLRAVSASRGLIEAAVRRRVTALPHVKLWPSTTALELVATSNRVCGIRFRSLSDDSSKVLAADLIVDATGRTSRTPEWLGALGFPRPVETRVPVHLRYASRTYRVPADVMRGRTALVYPATARRPRGALAQQIEGGRVRVSLLGYPGYEPIATPEGLSAHAASLGMPDIEQIVTSGEPLDDIASYGVAANVRRHYEALERFPEGLLVTGDAICAFNPSYAQGMTVAALEALTLRNLLASGDPNLAPRFFRQIAGVVGRVWMVGMANDLQIPSVRGPRPVQLRAMNAWMRQFFAAAQHDDELSVAFARVASLVDPPERLRSWAIARRVLARRCGLSPYEIPRGRVGHNTRVDNGLLRGRP
ncbi:MAG: FAD-binding monooxygenase [Luteitalea sp.]|nr:FAD-binding monooxygenase [Luteitalea sp.]